MGMGESLANLDNLIAALDRICSPKGLGLGQRRVTISTVGLPEKMRKLAALDRQYHLAVSLHAPTEPSSGTSWCRSTRRSGSTPVMEAADAYFQKTGRQVTFEYVLLAGVNDRPEDAQALAELLAARKSHVNLIPYNPVAGLPFERPSPAAVRRFVAIVRGAGGQRHRPEDQGPGDRRGLRPAPPPGRAGGRPGSPPRRLVEDRVGPAARRPSDRRARSRGDRRDAWNSSWRPATPTSG